MRILIVNANTSTLVTEKIEAEARTVASPGTEIVAVTEYRDIIGVAIQKAIEGAPAAQVAAQAQKEFQDMLIRTET